jgi:hypothetical protein
MIPSSIRRRERWRRALGIGPQEFSEFGRHTGAAKLNTSTEVPNTSTLTTAITSWHQKAIAASSHYPEKVLTMFLFAAQEQTENYRARSTKEPLSRRSVRSIFLESS